MLEDKGRRRETGREGGVCHESRKERGRERFLLPLHFINKSFLFEDSCIEASRALLQKEKKRRFPQHFKCVPPSFPRRKYNDVYK